MDTKRKSVIDISLLLSLISILILVVVVVVVVVVISSSSSLSFHNHLLVIFLIWHNCCIRISMDINNPWIHNIKSIADPILDIIMPPT